MGLSWWSHIKSTCELQCLSSSENLRKSAMKLQWKQPSQQNKWLTGRFASHEVSEGKNWIPSNTSAVWRPLANLVFSFFNLESSKQCLCSLPGHLRGQISFSEQRPLTTAETGVKVGDRKPNQTKTDGGRAEETLKIVIVQVILPSVTTSYHISESLSLRTTRACGGSIPSELSASVLDKQQNSLSSLFHINWETPDKPNEALWKKRFPRLTALLWTGCLVRDG